MRVAAASLQSAIDDLAVLDVDAVSDAELHDAVVALQRERARLGVVAARLLARWDARAVWAGDGSRSAAARLARETRCAQSAAKVELRRARQLASLPATAAAIDAGDLSLDHVDLLGRADRPWRHAVFADHEATLVEECSRLRYPQAVRLVEYWCQCADADAAERNADEQRERAHLHASTTLDGTVVVTGVLDELGGATFTAELDRLEHELYLADQRDGTVRTPGQRRAAALVEMATRSATAPANGRRPRPLFTILIGDDSFTRLCELADGTVTTPGQLVAHLGTAELETILFDGPTTVISASRRRTFTGAVRRAIEVRDRHCQHPSGCDEPASRCDVDHIVPWTDTADTSQFNGRLECPTHNRHTDRHDHDATPLPARPVDILDQYRARLQWQYLHDDDPP